MLVLVLEWSDQVNSVSVDQLVLQERSDQVNSVSVDQLGAREE